MARWKLRNWWKDLKARRARCAATQGITLAGKSSRKLHLESLESRELLAGEPRLLADLVSGFDSSFPREFVRSGDTTFFVANDTELWKTDGSSLGTVMIKDINPGVGYTGELFDLNGTLAFGHVDRNGTDFVLTDDRIQLWKSDGTTMGTTMVKDFGVGSTIGSEGAYFTSLGGTLFGVIDDGANGFELWKSDLSVSGTELVEDINPSGSAIDPFSDGIYEPLLSFNGALYFAADDGTSGVELWTSDGNSTGTQRLVDINPGSFGSYPVDLTAVNGDFFFGTLNFGTDMTPQTSDDSVELWKSDGTNGGTSMVQNFGVGSYSDYPQLTAAGGTLFGVIGDPVNGEELWKSPGTSMGAELVKDIFPGSYGGYPNSSLPFFLTNVDGTLFFQAQDGTSGNELWKSDGTLAGTKLVSDIKPGNYYGTMTPYGSNPANLVNVDGTLFFTAAAIAEGEEVWMSDGTSSGTVQVSDIGPSSYGAYIYELSNIEGTLYFGADDSSVGHEPWLLPPGYDDIVGRSNSSGDLWVSRSDGSSFSNVLAGNWPTTMSDVVVGDFNNDGLDDIAGRNDSGQWLVALADGVRFNSEVWGAWSTSLQWIDVLVGDFDNDGDDDIAGRADTGQWWLANSNGTDAFTNELWGAWSTNLPWVDVNVGDFNNDGADDIAGRREDGRWWLAQSNGTDAFTNELWGLWSTSLPWNDVQVGDVDNDGDDDILGRRADGRWWIANSNGVDSFANEQWGVWSTSLVWTDVFVDDFNHDGSADIAGRADNGQWWVSVSNGTDSFTNELWGLWSTSLVFSTVRTGDFNDDTFEDIAGRDQDGRWWVAVSDGSSFANVAWGRWSTSLEWVDVDSDNFLD